MKLKAGPRGIKDTNVRLFRAFGGTLKIIITTKKTSGPENLNCHQTMPASILVPRELLRNVSTANVPPSVQKSRV